MTYIKPEFIAGVLKDDSPSAAEPYYIDTDKVRFKNGRWQTIAGHELASTTSLTGICRGARTWVDNARNPYAAFGTHLRLYISDVDGAITDITPVIERGELTNPFDTTDTLYAVTVNDTAHGLVATQKVKFANATAGGGITINGEYTVTSVTSANAYVITHSVAATSTASGTGGTVDYEYFLAPGQLDGLGGLGFGTGGYGSGGYGGSSSGYTLYPRTWALWPFGQNLLANPRGGGLYEATPGVSTAEKITNGSFTGSATGWTLGVGWAYGGDVVTATLATSDLYQDVTLPVGCWCLLDFDMTRSAGSLQPYAGATAIGAVISAAGTYKREFWSGIGGTIRIKFTGTGFSGNVDNVSVKPIATATRITTAPSQITNFFVTEDRFVVLLGTLDDDSNFDALFIKWCEQEDAHTWTDLPTNLAGSDRISHGGRIVAGMAGNITNPIWTTDGMSRMTRVPDPDVVFRFDPVAVGGAGLIGPNAVTRVAGVFYWMTPTWACFASDSINVTPIKSTLSRDVKDNIAWVQQDKVFAFAVGQHGEAWWLYPDGRDGTNECGRYVMYAPMESAEVPVWANGTFDRTAWIDASVFQYPLAVDTDGAIWFQEKGFTEEGTARSWSIKTSDFEPGDGGNHFEILGIRPDAEDLQGGYFITITTKWRDGTVKREETFGPYGVTNATGQIDFRCVGEQMCVEWSGNDAPTFCRGGADKFDIRQRGRKR